MPVIRDANTLIGFLDRGEIVREFSKELAETLVMLKELSQLSGPKAKIKGKVALTISLEVQNGMVTIVGDIKTKTPEPLRGSTVFWVTEDGELSTEHPNQNDMFKPKDVPLDASRMRMTS